MVVPLALPCRHVGNHRAGVRGTGCSVSLAAVILGESQARAASRGFRGSELAPAGSVSPPPSPARAEVASAGRVRGAPARTVFTTARLRAVAPRCRSPVGSEGGATAAPAGGPAGLGVWCAGRRVEGHPARGGTVSGFLADRVLVGRCAVAERAGSRSSEKGERSRIRASEGKEGSHGVSVICGCPGGLWPGFYTRAGAEAAARAPEGSGIANLFTGRFLRESGSSARAPRNTEQQGLWLYYH